MSSDTAFGACPVPILQHDRILLGHGGGGQLSSQLLESVFLPAFGNAILDRLGDQAMLEVPAGRIAFTTDSYVVTPMFFSGGDIGRLAVCGTVNDLAVGGARPLYLAAAFILEEGLLIEDLRRVVASMRAAAAEAGISIVTGDTKVVGKGSGDKIYVTTTGIGVVPPGVSISADSARPGDAVIVSGTIGDHGMAIIAARQELGLQGTLSSDTAPLNGLVARMIVVSREIHAMRDPTRGGVASTLNEIARASKVGIEIDEAAIPVRDDVKGACEILGFDPLVVANEGKLVAFVANRDAAAVLDAMRSHPLGRDAKRIGTVTAEHPKLVVLRTGIGGTRVLDPPHGELLPRIC